jgi:hypothetical protein
LHPIQSNPIQSNTPHPETNQTTAAIKRAVICGEFEGAVDCCFRFGRLADALLLAATGGRELFQRTQERYLALNAGQPFVKVTTLLLPLYYCHFTIATLLLLNAGQPFVKGDAPR